MTPGRAAVADGTLDLSAAVLGWTEYGDTTFDGSWVIACDASVGHPDGGSCACVAGAAVDETGAWWAWRATVPGRHFGLAATWAEALTLMLVLRVARPDALVLCDHMGSIALAWDALAGRNRRRGRGWRKAAATFGPLPLPSPGRTTQVQYYDGHALHARAHRISNAVRVGEHRQMPVTGAALTVHCAAYAAGWSGGSDTAKYFPSVAAS